MTLPEPTPMDELRVVLIMTGANILEVACMTDDQVRRAVQALRPDKP